MQPTKGKRAVPRYDKMNPSYEEYCRDDKNAVDEGRGRAGASAGASSGPRFILINLFVCVYENGLPVCNRPISCSHF
jgi:hypothetical protein